MWRPAATRKALSRSPRAEARRTHSSRVERVPQMAAITRPEVMLAGRPSAQGSGCVSVDVRILANTAANTLQDTGIVHHELGSSNCGSIEEFSHFVRRVLLGEFRPQLAALRSGEI